MKTAWLLDGKIVVDATGKVVLCDTCPCTGATPTTCCTDGDSLPAVYIWGYFEGTNDGGSPPVAPGCLPQVCAPTADPGLTDGIFISYGEFTGGSFAWNQGGFTLSGSCGCVGVRLIGSCTGTYLATIDMNFGTGFLGPQTLLNEIIDTTHGDQPTTHQCILTLGCEKYGNASLAPGDVVFPNFYVTTRDPATGIATPDGTTIPTIITFSITLLNALGVPTVYSCSLVFAANNTDGFCYEWRGYLMDCSTGSCTLIRMWYDPSGPTWNIQAVTHTGAGDFRSIYSGLSFSTSGNATSNWADCGGGATVNPMWSITE